MRKRLLAVACAAAVITAAGCNSEQSAQENTETAVSAAEAEAAPSAAGAAADYEWGNVQIDGGGYTSGLYYNKGEKGLVYARTDIGGFYRMDNATGRWKPLTDQFDGENYTYYGIDGCAVDEKEPNKVYILAGMYKGWNAAVLCSDDYGDSWNITPLEFSAGGNEPNRFADRIVIDPNDNKTIYVGSRTNGLWVSHDSGSSFTQVSSFPTLGLGYKEDNYNFGITAVAFDSTSSSDGEPCRTIYVGTGDKTVYSSNDGGETWSLLGGAPTDFLPLHIYTESDNVYFVFGSSAGPYQMSSGAIMKYNAKTSAWTDITPDETGHGWGDLEIDPNNPETLYASSMGKWGGEENDCIYRSTDGGASWEGLFSGDGNNKIFEVDYSEAPWLDWGSDHAKLGWMMGDIEIDPFNSDEIIYGTGATIIRSKNLTKWGSETVEFEVHCLGVEETAVLSLCAANSDDIRLYSGMGDIDGFTHHDVDKVEPHMNGDGFMTTTQSISCAYNNPLVAARTGNGNMPIAVTTDGGETWKNIKKPKGVGGDCGTVEVNCDGTKIYWTNKAAAAVYVTSDIGKTWEKLEKAFANAKISADCSDPDVLYVYTGGALYATKDGGKTFKSSSLFIPDGCSIEASPEKTGDIWLATNMGGVFLVTDFGQGELIKKNITAAECIAIGAAKDENSPMALYVIGTNDGVRGVYRSTDSGESWERINDDMHRFGACGGSIAADLRTFGQVYFGTNGRGIIMGRLK